MKYFLEGIAIAGGGALGALVRWLVGLGCGQIFGHAFPVGTIVINVTGSFILGWFVARGQWSDTTRLGVAVGFVGAYTTFSTYMMETISLWDNAAFARATANILISIVLGLIAVRLGMALATVSR